MSVNTVFPNAISIKELKVDIIRAYADKNIDLSDSIWATSICSDEVNNLFPEFSHLFAGPGAFTMGGISGLPFTGITGLKAFLSHMPDNGAAMIIYGPHIGYSSDEEVGFMNRQNQSAKSASCGSLHAALGALKADKTPTEHSLDYQQAQVYNMLKVKEEEIMAAEDQLKKATEVAYETINTTMHKIVDEVRDELSGIRLYLIGGIIINTDWHDDDYFEVHHQEFYEF